MLRSCDAAPSRTNAHLTAIHSSAAHSRRSGASSSLTRYRFVLRARARACGAIDFLSNAPSRSPQPLLLTRSHLVTMSELLDGSIPVPEGQSAATWPPQLPPQPPRPPHVRPIPGTRVTRNDGFDTGKEDGCASTRSALVASRVAYDRCRRLSVALRRASSLLLGSLDKVISKAAALDPAATTFFTARAHAVPSLILCSFSARLGSLLLTRFAGGHGRPGPAARPRG